MSNFENVKAEQAKNMIGFSLPDNQPIGDCEVAGLVGEITGSVIAAELTRRWNLHERLVKSLDDMANYEPSKGWAQGFLEEARALLREAKGGK